MGWADSTTAQTVVTDGLHGGTAARQSSSDKGLSQPRQRKNEGEEEGKREKVNVGGGALAEGERK